MPEERIIRLPGNRQIFYDRLTDEQRSEIDVQLAEFFALVEKNPIQGFDWHSEAQREFLSADTPIIAAFAGNRFGKTTSLVVKALIECLPSEALPERLRAFKRFSERVDGWIFVPTEDKLFDSIKPAFEKWVGPEFFRGGNWGKAFNGERMQLTFANGSTIGFKTYKQDPSTLGGASLWFVGYDEPPPKEHRDEGRTRLIDHSGFEMFAMTPLKTNTGWIRREIFKKRESPNITLVRGSIHDNARLPKKAIAEWLSGFENDLWRRAREFGDFVDMGGQIYEEFDRRLIDPPLASWVQAQPDHVVSIDPGVRNCGIVFGCFDDELVGTVYDELLLQNATVEDYAKSIRSVLAKWGIPLSRVLFVIDPAARSRSQINAQSVQSALAALGIGCADGQNAVEAGIQQVRGRLQHKRLWISRACVLLRDEADEYAAEDRPDGEFKPIKQNDHLCDALRYWAMTHPWFPQLERTAHERNLGFEPNRAIPARYLQPAREVAPLGFMS